MAQFLGAMYTNLDQLIWKAWAPPKCKIFAWLAYQNRLWTADRLERRGCPLCRHTDESVLHLFAQCRYTRHLWTELGASVPAATADMASWDTCDSAAQWWKVASASTELSPKTMRSLLLLISWEIWNERNGRIFRHKESSVQTLLVKIKEEARPGA